MAKVVKATDNGRTSQSSVTDMKIRRGDVGYVDPIAKKLRVDRSLYYSAKNISAVDPDEIDKTFIESRVWPWERSAKTWLDGEEGKKTVEAIKNGTYEFNDPEHDFLWETRAGMTALGVDPLVIAFYNELYKRFRDRPDFDKQYTTANFGKFWNDYYCRQLMIDVYSAKMDLTDEQKKELVKAVRYSTEGGYKEAHEAIFNWYKEGGNRYFGGYHYADTINRVKDYVMQNRTVDALVANVTPEFFMSLGICSEYKHGAMYKKGVHQHVGRYAVNDIYQGIINSDVINIGLELQVNPEHFIEGADKDRAKLEKALKAAPIALVDELTVVVDKDTQKPYAIVPIESDDEKTTNIRFPLTVDQLYDLNYAFSNSYVVFDTNSGSIAFNCMDIKEAHAWSRSFLETHNSLVRSRARGFTQVFELDNLTRTGYLYREGSVASEQNIQCESYEPNGKGGKELTYKGEILDRFGLSGITFGSTTSLNARTAFVNSVYDSFRDIENVLHSDIPSLFGENLALSYGASGKPPELAHHLYVAANATHSININYRNGYGSFGHELMHALDSEMGKRIFSELSLDNYSDRSGPYITESFGNAPKSWRDALQANYPAAYELASFITDSKTAYFRKSFTFENPDAEKPYWTAPCEMFARAAAVYLEQKFEELGFRNDFLSGNSKMISENSEGLRIEPIPDKEEQDIFNNLMDNFLAELKERNVIKDVPETNTKSLYAERHPDEPDKYNVIIKSIVSPLPHMFEKTARAKKADQIKINDFDPANIKHATAYVKTALPSLDSRNERIDVSKLKTIVEDKKNKQFAFEVR